MEDTKGLPEALVELKNKLTKWKKKPLIARMRRYLSLSFEGTIDINEKCHSWTTQDHVKSLT